MGVLQQINRVSIGKIIEGLKYPFGDPAALIKGDARFAELPKSEVNQAIKAALWRNQEVGQNIPLSADKIFNAHTELKAGKFTPPAAVEPLSYTILSEEQVQARQARQTREPKKPTTIHDIQKAKHESFADRIAQGQRFAGGVNLAFAALSAIFAIDSARKINKTDELGQNHVQWTHVGLTVLNTALAAGLGYAGVKGLQAGHAR